MRSSLLLAIYFLSASLGNHLCAQANCDPSLPGIKESSLGYRDRGDRCEGLYINQVSSTTLFVASFTEYFEAFDNNTTGPLLVEWDKVSGNDQIHLRAQALKQRLYYRMDSYQPAAATFYSWPSGVLASLKIGNKDIGLVGKTKLMLGKTAREIYLPLRIRKQGEAKRPGVFTLIVLPGVQLSEIFISVASTGTDGNPAVFISKDKKLEYGYYPAERKIEIPVAKPLKTGIYYLKIAAEIKSGGTRAIELWFYNQG